MAVCCFGLFSHIQFQLQFVFLTVPGMELCFGYVLNTGDNTEMVLFLLSRAHPGPRPFLLSTVPPWEETERGDSQES